MRFSTEELAAVFDPATLARGNAYQRRDAVVFLNADDDGALISALVQGTGRRPYRTIVRLSRDLHGKLQVRGQCSCPVTFNCKHAVAALLAQLAKGWERAAGAGAPDGPALRLWLDSVEQVTRQGDGGYPPSVKERLLYVLDPDNRGGVLRLVLRIRKARLLKDGGYGRASGYSANPYSSAKFVLPTDQSILREIAQHSRYGEVSPKERWGAELLRAMLATGRCHWRDIGQPALALADPRPGSFIWRADAAGRQRLTLEVAGAAVILPLAPPWFVDEERRACGPIETGMRDALAGALAAAPALAPEQLAPVVERLERLVPPGALPAPARIEVVHNAGVVPVPCLHLDSVSRGGAAVRGAGAYKVDIARLGFDYGGCEVAAGTEGASLSRREGDRLIVTRRDPKAEQAAFQRLREIGFQNLHYLDLPENSLAHGEGEPGWLDFVLSHLPLLEREGWRIVTEPGFRYRVTEPADWSLEIDDGGANPWFELGMGIEVEGQRFELLPILSELIQDMPQLAPAALEQLDGGTSFLVRLDQARVLRLPVERVRPILATLAELYEPAALDDNGRLQLSRLASPALLELDDHGPLQWQGGQAVRAFARKLQGFDGVKDVASPAGLRAKLRPYQKEGLAWLQFLREWDLGGVLADDMGLGKTVQTLAHVLLEQESGRADKPSLVVAPTSLVHNWRREAARFAPQLKVLVLHGAGRKDSFGAIPGHHLVLTTYPLIVRDREALLAHDYHLLILDEAQVIKNPRAKAAEAVRQIPARHRLCLTGTPMENHLGELWSLFHFLMPGLLGDERRFRRLFRTPVEKHGDQARRELLARRIRPFLLRRTKSQVAAELPRKTEIVRTVRLEGPQRDLYETVRAAMHQKVRDAIAEKGMARSHIIILEALLKLRQCCCDPRLMKLGAAKKVGHSAKLELLMDILPELVEEGRRILLFSQFTTMLGLIEAELERRGLPYVKLTGRTRNRAEPVDRFQAGQVPIFLISLKAGGTGLNLTAADTVIHYDPWWNPAVENQATDRAHRIGQDKPVFVYKLLVENTVEEKIAALQTRKQALADAMLEGGAAGPKLSGEDLAHLFEPLE